MKRRALVCTATVLAGLAMLSLAGRLAAADNPAAKGHANARLSALAVEGDKTLHVFYRDHDGTIIELFTKQGDNTGWHRNDVTTEANAPKAASGPNAIYATDTKTAHVFYRSTDDGVHELFRNANGRWGHNDLTKSANAPKAAGEPAGYVEDDNKTQHVIFRTAEGGLVELYSKYGETASWKMRDLSKDANAPKAAGSPDAFYWRHTKSQHVVYRGDDGNVHELFMEPNGQWSHANLTEGAKGAAKAAGDPCVYLEDATSTQHVCYRSTDGAIVELSAKYKQGPGWTMKDVSKEANAPKAEGDPSAYVLRQGRIRTTSTQHIVYRGQDDGIFELYLGGPQNKWAVDDLSKVTNSPKAAGDPVGFVFEADETQHVVFQTGDGTIFELYNVPTGPQRGWHGHALMATGNRTP